MTTLQEMKSRVGQYLSEQETLDDFHAWFTAEAVAYGRGGDSATREFVDAVDGLFLRLSEQEITEDEFDAALREAVEPPVTVEIRYSAISWTVSTDLRSASSDTRHLVASG